MTLLLDTHVLLWWLDDPQLLSNAARSAIADGKNTVYISAAVAWEIAIKRSLGKLDAPDDLEAAMVAAEGALAEARKQIEREASRSAAAEQRNRELSERVIAEAAKAQAFAAGVEQLGGSRRYYPGK